VQTSKVGPSPSRGGLETVLKPSARAPSRLQDRGLTAHNASYNQQLGVSRVHSSASISYELSTIRDTVDKYQDLLYSACLEFVVGRTRRVAGTGLSALMRLSSGRLLLPTVRERDLPRTTGSGRGWTPTSERAADAWWATGMRTSSCATPAGERPSLWSTQTRAHLSRLRSERWLNLGRVGG
jgi:hypothetical protein